MVRQMILMQCRIKLELTLVFRGLKMLAFKKSGVFSKAECIRKRGMVFCIKFDANQTANNTFHSHLGYKVLW